MLKDAALLQLDLLLAALNEGMTLKDATPFNVQWRGSQPIFIDVASFERLEAGDPWVGYRQFCQLFLYPLFFQAYKDVAFQPWLRGSLEGIEPEQCKRLMSTADMFRPGVLRHVHLHAAMQQGNQSTAHSVKAELRDAGLPSELIRHNVESLRRLIARLSWKRSTSAWSDYETTNSYGETDQRSKTAFVDDVAGLRAWNLVWDIGCNTGTYSRVLAKHARSVIAIDADHLVIERLYETLKHDRDRTVLPLVMSLTDPSPGLGWRGLERRALVDRGRPDLVVCLALIHHVVIAGHVPLAEFVGWLASITDALVIEFVTKADPMVAKLLQNKPDIYDDYEPGDIRTLPGRALLDRAPRTAVLEDESSLFRDSRCRPISPAQWPDPEPGFGRFGVDRQTTQGWAQR